ncbi:MAG: hypothetical protein OXU74_01960 [Gemmatimonadota bacterium]|nr:hypothetical protein [Gemmatimonadota bacterium]
MVIGTAKNDIAYTQQLCSGSVGEFGLPCGDPGTQTHAVDMILQQLDLGAAGLNVRSGRAVEAIEIRFGYVIWIDQEQPTNPGSREEFDDRTTGTATADDAYTKLPESCRGFLAYGQNLPSKEPLSYSGCGVVFGLAGVGELGAHNADRYWLWSSFRPPKPCIYPAVTSKENADQNVIPLAIPASEKISKVRFVLVILMRKSWSGCWMTVAYPRVKLFVAS